MPQHQIGRRHFLRGVGGSALFLPYLDAMAANAAVSSETDDVPKRMVCIGNNFGYVPHLFFPEQTGTDYQMPDLLKPLEKHRSDLTIFSKLDHGTDGVGGHGGIHAFLSGILSKNSKGYPESNISVDQKAAQFIGSETRYQSLQLGTSTATNHMMSWTSSGVAIPPITSLTSIYDLLFQQTAKQQLATVEKQIESQTSILDLVKTDADLLMKKVGKRDQEKLDRYFSSIRSVETQLAQSKDWLHKPKPTVDYTLPNGADNLDFAERLPLYYDLITLALQTDSTRVITFATADIGRNGGGLGITRGYHQLTHHGKVPGYIQELSIIERFLIKQFARFLDQLSGIDEPNGKTLLDNTITLFGSGMGNASSHSNRNLPLILAGGGFKNGRHISYENGKSPTPASNLFVSMLQQFGAEVDQFGRSTGTLSGLEA